MKQKRLDSGISGISFALVLGVTLLASANPGASAETNFDGLPADWTSSAWTAGGTAIVAGGALAVDGARAGSQALYGPGHSIELVATFTGAPWQHAGFGIDYSAAPWIIFSTFEGGQLYARTAPEAGSALDTVLPGDWLGAPHRYRIDWQPDRIVFSIDGAVVATHAVAIGTPLHPIVSDFTTGDGSLRVSSMRLFASGSRVDFDDPGLPADWISGAWTAGGTSAVDSGRLVVDGAWAGTAALAGPRRSMEFVATFTGAPWQHAGLGVDFNAAPWIIFSTFQGGQLYARTASDTAGAVDTPLPGEWLGTPHRYRIDWDADRVVFSIDGAVVATHDVVVSTPLRVLVSDFATGDGVLTIDSIETTVPIFDVDFSGGSLPAGWSSGAWQSGGSAQVDNGLLTVDGAWAGVDTLSGPGSSLEFVATFTGAPWQHIGFGVDYNAAPWIVFSTFQGGQLHARTSAGAAGAIDTALPGDWLGAPHRYRIAWEADQITFSIDGAVVATHAVAVSTPQRPLISDFDADGDVLTVDSLAITP